MKTPLQISKFDNRLGAPQYLAESGIKGNPGIFKSIFEQELVQESPGITNGDNLFPDQNQSINKLDQEPQLSVMQYENSSSPESQINLSENQRANGVSEEINQDNLSNEIRPDSKAHQALNSQNKQADSGKNVGTEDKDSFNQDKQVTAKSAKHNKRAAVSQNDNASLKSNYKGQNRSYAAVKLGHKETATGLFGAAKEAKITRQRTAHGQGRINTRISARKETLAFTKDHLKHSPTEHSIKELSAGLKAKQVMETALQNIKAKTRKTGSDNFKNKRILTDSQEISKPKSYFNRPITGKINKIDASQLKENDLRTIPGKQLKGFKGSGLDGLRSKHNSSHSEPNSRRTESGKPQESRTRMRSDLTQVNYKADKNVQFVKQNSREADNNTKQPQNRSDSASKNKSGQIDHNELKKADQKSDKPKQSSQDSGHQTEQKKNTGDTKISQSAVTVKIGKIKSDNTSQASIPKSSSVRQGNQAGQQKTDKSGNQKSADKEQPSEKKGIKLSAKKQTLTTDKFINTDNQKLSVSTPDLLKYRFSAFMKSHNMTELQGLSRIRIDLIEKITQIVNIFNSGKTTQTNFHVDGKEYGPLEIQFAKGPTGDQATILVENETVKAALRKYMPSVYDSLQQKGVLLSSLDVEINDRHKQKAFGSLNYWQAGDAQQQNINSEKIHGNGGGTVSTTPRYYGYNTMEVIA